MEGSEKIDLEHNCSKIGLDLGSRPSENVSQMAAGSNSVKPPDIHSSHSSSNRVVDGELASMKVSPETDPKQVIPLAISLSSGVRVSGGALGLEGTSTSRASPAEFSMSDKTVLRNLSPPVGGSPAEPACLTGATSMDVLQLKNDSRLENSSAMQPAVPAGAHRGELPSRMSLKSDGGHVLQLAPAASAVPTATLETEDGHLASDEGTEKPLKKDKIKKRPRQLLQDARTRDLNKSSEKQPVIRWKDVWVAQLIHIRGRMHSTFTSPQRQRVDLWQIVKHEMANSCHGFDKDSEACRKKWIRVYKEYKDDLHLASDEKTQKCRFYDLVDFYMGDRANSFRNMSLRPEFIPFCPEVMHAAKELTVPPASNEVDVKAMDGGAIVPQVSSDTQVSNQTAFSIAKKPPLAKKPRVIEKPLQLEKPPPLLEAPVEASSKRPHMKSSVQTMLSELVSIGKEMLQTTREFEKEKLAVLHSIKDTLGKIAKKI